jgi:hypothetical protein
MHSLAKAGGVRAVSLPLCLPFALPGKDAQTDLIPFCVRCNASSKKRKAKKKKRRA